MSLFRKLFNSLAVPLPDEPLPEYRLRVSARARYVRLRLTPRTGLEVVIPKGFDSRKVPAILRSRREWLDSAMRELQSRARPADDECLPATVSLRACGQLWTVDYRQTRSTRVSTRTVAGRIQVTGNISDKRACYAALRRWLLRQAHLELVPWLESLSHTHSLPYKNTRVRMQKTRWGSCSSNGTISINAQLLFLEKHHVEYVLLHELCHTVYMNHSSQFWAMLASLQPAYKSIHQDMREAWQFIPAWTSHVE